MADQTWTRPVTGLITLALSLAVVAAVGCSSNSDSPDGDGGSADEVISCVNDPRTEPFALNLTHKGDSGMLSFVIAGSMYTPLAVGTNMWTLKILDASGQPVKDAMVTFPKNGHQSDPWMPDHTHGTTPAKAKNNMDGTYTLTPLYLFMGGVWSTYISATSGSVTDTTTFTFCVGS
jgi:YtkA-like